jgi:signal transduction histidine kinase
MHSSPGNSPHPLHIPILLVDDRPANLLALEVILRSRGEPHDPAGSPDEPQLPRDLYELVNASSGPEAIARATEREFAVILLDLHMPGMDGVETALALQRLAGASGRVVPVIFVTATDATLPRVRSAYSSGGVDFISKPLDPFILRSKVAVFADLYRARQRLLVEIDQRKRLQDALRARDDLLAIVAHDLRNPLHSVLVGSTHIEHAAQTGEWDHAHKAAAAITRAVDRMTRLVDNLLDLATLDSGRPLSMDLQRHDLGDLVREITEVLEPLAQAGHLTLTADVEDGGAGSHVLCDRDRVQQVLANLIGNAIKFTKTGGSIAVTASRRGDEFVVSVRDTGVGIRSDQVPRIFEPYWKADPTRKDGTGLGLSIAKSIVEAHAGRIWVEAEAGRGSTFSFTLGAPSEADAYPSASVA